MSLCLGKVSLSAPLLSFNHRVTRPRLVAQSFDLWQSGDFHRHRYCAGTTPTGTVTFKNGTNILGTATLNAGVATFTTNNLSAVGSPWTITAVYSGDGNYGSQTNTVGQTVNPATLTYMATAASQAYGSANTNFTGSVTGFVSGDTQASATTGTLAFASTTTTASPVGSYAIIGSGLSAGNYTFGQAGGNATALTITNAGLSITASPQSKTYGTALSLGTSAFTASGLQNNETVGAVTLTASGSPAGTAANAAAGLYTITPSFAMGGSGTESNYNITYYTGTLTVNPLAGAIDRHPCLRRHHQRQLCHSFGGEQGRQRHGQRRLPAAAVWPVRMSARRRSPLSATWPWATTPRAITPWRAPAAR